MNHNQKSDIVTGFWKSVQITVSSEELSAAVETYPQSQGGFQTVAILPSAAYYSLWNMLEKIIIRILEYYKELIGDLDSTSLQISNFCIVPYYSWSKMIQIHQESIQ